MTSSSTEIERYSDVYPEDLNTNFKAEFHQFHSYVHHKYSAPKNVKTKFNNAELYKIIVVQY